MSIRCNECGLFGCTYLKEYYSASDREARHGGPMKHRLEPKKGATNKQAELLKEAEDKKDVHTEHCCYKHGCKYCNENCPVKNGINKQSYTCENCNLEKYQNEQETQVLMGFILFLRQHNRKPGVLSVNEMREIITAFQEVKHIWVD